MISSLAYSKIAVRQPVDNQRGNGKSPCLIIVMTARSAQKGIDDATIESTSSRQYSIDKQMNLIAFALRRPVTILVLMLAIILAGVLALERMPRDIFPDLGIPRFTSRSLMGEWIQRRWKGS